MEGENAAAEYFISKGYKVLRRNYRYARTEVDLIVEKDNWLVFVEVKTRSGSEFGFPESFVDRQKEQNILFAAENYMFHTDWKGNVRYDIISILNGVIEHFEDAFY